MARGSSEKAVAGDSVLGEFVRENGTAVLSVQLLISVAACVAVEAQGYDK